MSKKRTNKGHSQPTTEEEFDIKKGETPPTWTELMTNFFQSRIGDLGLSKGTLKSKEYSYNDYQRNIALYIWDSAPACTGTKEIEDANELHDAYPDEYPAKYTCPVRDLCTFTKAGHCSTQVNYIKAVIKFVIMNYYRSVSERQMFEFGMHILPIYRILCKMKLEELSVNSILTKTGAKANPIYKEIRETYKLINQMWKDSGILALKSELEDKDDKDQVNLPDMSDFMDGSGNHYENIESGGLRPLERDGDGRPVPRKPPGSGRRKKI